MTIAIDAMGGDRAPAAIVAGALQAAATLDVDVLLVGRPTRSARTCPTADRGSSGSRSSTRPRSSRWTRPGDRGAHEARLRRSCAAPRPCATARADAMVGAGNTGATMAAALLRFGRIPGVQPARDRGAGAGRRHRRPASCSSTAAPRSIPSPSGSCSGPGSRGTYARVRLGVDEPTIALLSNGEEPGKGDALRKAAFELLAGVKGFVGNVEGRDLSRVVGRRDRHRRLHRQRRVEDARRRDVRRSPASCSAILDEPEFAVGRAARSSCGCSSAAADCCPTRPAARCCSASTACA